MTALAPIIDFLFPPQCLNCKAGVGAHGTLCLGCWSQIRFITEPMCHCCGLPFDFALGEGALCAECMRDPPPFDAARAAFRYDEHSRGLVLKLKYHDLTYLAPIYGRWLAKAGRELILRSDVIVPVPLYYWRFVSRRYNQAALLARALAKETGCRALPDGLKRIRHTLPQTGLSRAQRAENVKGAFAVNACAGDLIRGKSVLLIDDVMTTNATIAECARVLKKGGAREVNVLTLARRAD